MKNAIKFHALALLLLVASHSFAQVEQGDINVGLNGFVSSTNVQNTTTTVTSVLASGQYYLTDNISAGIGPQLTLSSSDDSKTTVVGLNLFGNYNFLLPNGEILPYAGANLFLQSLLSESGRGATSSEFTYNYVNLGFNAGAKYFLTERINIDSNIGYTFMVAASAESNGNDLPIDADGGVFQFTFGLGILLGRIGE